MKNYSNTLADLLTIIADNLRSGNSNVDADQLDMITAAINGITNYERQIGTDEAIKFLKVSRNYFYDHVKPILKGVKIPGQKTIYYTKKELEKYRNIHLQVSKNQ